MRSTVCDTVGALIDREAIGWTEAERLRVEQHLGECESCSESLSLSRFVRDTLKKAAGELSEGARSRAIKNALSATATRKPSLRVARTGPRWALGLGLAAAAAITLWLVRTPAPETAKLTQRPAAIAHSEKPPATQPKPVEVPPDTNDGPVLVESKGRESHTFAHATVAFAPATRTRFDAATRTLSLEQGTIDVDVDASRGQTFSVLTQNFRVEVLGTRFSVNAEGVRVEHGRVRVLSREGAELRPLLSAGETFQFGQDKPASAHPSSKATKPSPASASALLTEARAALSRDDKAGARALIKQAEVAHPSRAERAELGTLRAELSLLEQNSAEALRAYRDVATKYAELPAGENAAFAAAQLATKAAPTETRPLLAAYLERYPHGRFVNEARERLRRLGAR
jgi:hypothetical protein